jgi:hypothetical protein
MRTSCSLGAEKRVAVILNCVRIVILNPCRGLVSRRFVHLRRVSLGLHFFSRPALTLGLIVDFRVIIYLLICFIFYFLIRR